VADSISLPTTNGRIELSEADASGKCVGCKSLGGGMMQVRVTNPDATQTAGTFKVCGNCIAEALSGRIGEYVERARRELRERLEEGT
jgi:hypothetical protein